MKIKYKIKGADAKNIRIDNKPNPEKSKSAVLKIVEISSFL